MEKFKNIFGSNETNQSEETGIIDDLWKNSTLSWSTRIKGFIALFVLGTILSVLASIFFWLGIGGLIVFAVLFTLGNICSMCSTLFLMGPVSQLKKMFASTRLIATIIVIGAFALTLISAIVLDNAGLCLLFIIIQYLALIWYSLSYIPFARDAAKKLCCSLVDV